MERAARVAAVVTAHPALCDAYLRLGVACELAAGRVWTHIAAHHRRRIRAERLTMTRSSHCGEDTVRTENGAPVRRRSHRDVLPRLAITLYTALQTGMPPSKIRSVIPDRRTPGTEHPRCSRNPRTGAVGPIVSSVGFNP